MRNNRQRYFFFTYSFRYYDKNGSAQYQGKGNIEVTTNNLFPTQKQVIDSAIDIVAELHNKPRKMISVVVDGWIEMNEKDFNQWLSEDKDKQISNTELKAITYNYTQDGLLCNKVIGVFTKEQLESALNDIINGFGEDKKLVVDRYDKSCDNYFLEFDDADRSYFYTSDYTVGELRL